MKRKKQLGARAAAAQDQKPVRICFERIIPDALDSERNVRRVLRETMLEGSDAPLDPDEVMRATRLAVVNSKKWPGKQILRCRFLDGSSAMKRRVEEVAHRWEAHESVTFKFVSSGEAQIRISFSSDTGSWSAVGRDALNSNYFPLHQPTMNFGWLREDTPAEECSRVVLHEFGHALSCLHEHQQPEFDRVWDEAAVLKYFRGPPNFWTDEEIRHNVLRKYSAAGVSATRFDPESIMLYYFDERLFADGKGPTNDNSRLSSTDIEMIGRMYPR